MKKVFIVLVALAIVAISLTTTFAFVEDSDQWHNASSIVIRIDSYNISLQEAIDNGYLFGARFPTQNGNLDEVYHYADEYSLIYDGYTMTLQDALNNNVFSNGATGDYGFQLNKTFHNSYEIKTISSIGEELDFQSLVNQGKLTCFPFTNEELGYTCGTTSDGCGDTLTFGDCPGQTCIENHCQGECESGVTETIICSDLESTYPCRDYIDSTTRDCDNQGAWSSYTCSYTNLAKGIIISVSLGACDGAGSAVTSFSGKGCSACIWGSSGSYCNTKSISSTKRFSGPKCDSKDGSVRWTTVIENIPSSSSSSDSSDTSTSTDTSDTTDTSDYESGEDAAADYESGAHNGL